MRALWIGLLPLLFVPNNFGFDGATQFGELELMDIVVIPLLPIILFLKPKEKFQNKGHYVILRNFILWAFIGLLVFVIKYNYRDFHILFISVSRLLKFSLYCYFSYLVYLRYSSGDFKWYFLMMVLIGLELSYSITILKFGMDQKDARDLYSADNVIGTTLALLLSYITSILIIGDHRLPKLVVRFTYFSYPILLLGHFLSDGRGAMIAYIVSMIYLSFKMSNSARTWIGLLAALFLVIYFYQTQEEFKYDVDRTFLTNTNESSRVQFDDGRRGSAFQKELPKFLLNPIFGTGFFHRGYKTTIIPVGSHNFLLQMLLETGVIGLALWVRFFRFLWKRKTYYKLETRILVLTSLLASFSGEYFYGSEALMVFLLLLVTLQKEKGYA